MGHFKNKKKLMGFNYINMELKHKFAIYVPLMGDLNQKGCNDPFVEAIAHFFVTKFGNCTAIDGVGYRETKDGKITTGPVTILWAITSLNRRELCRSRRELRESAKWLRDALLIENIIIEIDGEAEIIYK